MSPYEEIVWLRKPGRGAWIFLCCFEHHKLLSIGRFWYREIRDFLFSKRMVQRGLDPNKTSGMGTNFWPTFGY